jgi:hypothetical protein
MSFVNFCSICTVLSCLKQTNQATFIQIYSLPVAGVFSIESTELHTAIGKLQILSDKQHGIKVVIGLMCSDLPLSDRWLQSHKIITLYTDNMSPEKWQLSTYLCNFPLLSISEEIWHATIFKSISINLLIRNSFQIPYMWKNWKIPIASSVSTILTQRTEGKNIYINKGVITSPIHVYF